MLGMKPRISALLFFFLYSTSSLEASFLFQYSSIANISTKTKQALPAIWKMMTSENMYYLASTIYVVRMTLYGKKIIQAPDPSTFRKAFSSNDTKDFSLAFIPADLKKDVIDVLDTNKDIFTNEVNAKTHR